ELAGGAVVGAAVGALVGAAAVVSVGAVVGAPVVPPPPLSPLEVEVVDVPPWATVARCVLWVPRTTADATAATKRARIAAPSALRTDCVSTHLVVCGVERVTGVEPASPAWKAGALPLSYTRGSWHGSRPSGRTCRGGEIRTPDRLPPKQVRYHCATPRSLGGRLRPPHSATCAT